MSLTLRELPCQTHAGGPKKSKSGINWNPDRNPNGRNSNRSSRVNITCFGDDASKIMAGNSGRNGRKKRLEPAPHLVSNSGKVIRRQDYNNYSLSESESQSDSRYKNILPDNVSAHRNPIHWSHNDNIDSQLRQRVAGKNLYEIINDNKLNHNRISNTQTVSRQDKRLMIPAGVRTVNSLMSEEKALIGSGKTIQKAHIESNQSYGVTRALAWDME